MRALLITGGSHGDIHPFIALGRQLAQHAVTVSVMTNPWYEQEIRAEGLDCLPLVGESLDVGRFIRDNPWMNDPRQAGRRLFDEVIVPTVGESIARISEAIVRDRPDVAVIHPLVLAAPSICQAHRIPWVSVSLAPMTWLSREEAIHPMPLPLLGLRMPRWLWRLLLPLSMAMMRRWADAAITRELTARNLPTSRDYFVISSRGHSPDPRAPRAALSIGFWSPAFRGPMADDPPDALIAGFPWHDHPSGTSPALPELEEFLGDGEAPIVFTLGTASVHSPGRFFESAIEAARALGKRAVLLTGRGNPPPSGLPSGVIAVPYAPFSWLMPRALINVHHGGIGSTGQSLRAGRPSLIVPHSHDQFDNAARVKRLGCGDVLLKRTPAALERALRRTLQTPAIGRAAAEIAPRVAPDGAKTAAQHLLRIAERSAILSPL